MPANDKSVTLDISSSSNSFASAELGCVHTGCSTYTNFQLQFDTNEYANALQACPLPLLDLSFYLTDFKTVSEFLSISINDHLYGLCDGGSDDVYDSRYQCLYKADISDWVFTNSADVTQILINLNSSSHVDSLDSANVFKQLINAQVNITCMQNTPAYNKKQVSGILDSYNANAEYKTLQLDFECQGMGCSVTADFDVIGICTAPTLYVAFWLSGMKIFYA